MKNTQRLAALLTALLVALFWSAALATSETRVFDGADLFTAAQEQALTAAITAFQKDTGMDFVFVTSDEAHGDASQQEIADAFYEKGGFGLDADKSGALYYIDMYAHKSYISTTGAMIDFMTDERIESALDQSSPSLTAGRYADAAQAMLAAVAKFVKAGIPEGQYRYDIVTGQMLTARHKALTGTEMLVGGVLCLLIGILFIAGVSSRYRLKGSTYRYDYDDNADMQLTEQEDQYLNTTVTRTRKAPPPDGGGRGGFGGGSGGSGVHMGGGGVSHGGGGRSF